MSVAIRLRRDTSNIVGAFEWASDSEQWTPAGELLTGSTMAFFVALQISEYRAMADRALRVLATTDPELAGYVRAQQLFALGMLQDWPPYVTMARELTTGPTEVLRSNGWAMLAWLAAFTDAEVSRKFNGRAQAEYDRLDAIALEREAMVPFAAMRWAAATGRVISESDDSLVLLAALTHREGDDEVARQLLSSTGLERQPSTIAYAGDLARGSACRKHSARSADGSGSCPSARRRFSTCRNVRSERCGPNWIAAVGARRGVATAVASARWPTTWRSSTWPG